MNLLVERCVFIKLFFDAVFHLSVEISLGQRACKQNEENEF